MNIVYLCQASLFEPEVSFHLNGQRKDSFKSVGPYTLMPHFWFEGVFTIFVNGLFTLIAHMYLFITTMMQKYKTFFFFSLKVEKANVYSKIICSVK